MKQKVMAYILRNRGDLTEILVFDHCAYPEVSPQVVAGTVDPNEDHKEAVIREAFEESGLELSHPEFIGKYPFFREDIKEEQERHVFAFKTSNLPESWFHIVSAGEEDKGLKFYFHWMPLAEAESKLKSKMGDYIIDVPKEIFS